MLLARTDRSLIGRWWWTLDRVLLGSLALLVAIGIVLVIAASPAVGVRKEGSAWHFVFAQLAFLGPGALLLWFCSLLSARGVLRLGTFVYVLAGIGLAVVMVAGVSVNGAVRWVQLGGQRLQPSEFIKPAIVVVCARFLADRQGASGLPLTVPLVVLPLAMVAHQPDLGTAGVILSVYAIQLFMAGIAWLWVVALGAGGLVLTYAAYLIWPHFALRVDAFMGDDTLGYQIGQALKAIAAGGLFGRGPGEGIVKNHLPDAHSDFIFAATAEEFGILFCLCLVGLFVGIVGRALYRINGAQDRFVQLAATGLISGFAVQAFINMAVNLHLMPTKGMTLPFISYGGSSLLAMSLGMGMLLALTRRGARLDRR